MTADPPVSVKVALAVDDGWVLLRNDRGEWELPGGRVDDTDISLVDTARRECSEALGVEVIVGALVDAWLFDVIADKRVVVVCFAAEIASSGDLTISEEHDAVAIVGTDELDNHALPDGYRSALLSAGQMRS